MWSRQIKTDFNGFSEMIKNGTLFKRPEVQIPQKECKMKLRMLCSNEMLNHDPSIMATSGIWKQFPLSQFKNVIASDVVYSKNTQNMDQIKIPQSQAKKQCYKEQQDSQMLIMHQQNEDHQCESNESIKNAKKGKTARNKKNKSPNRRRGKSPYYSKK